MNENIKKIIVKDVMGAALAFTGGTNLALGAQNKEPMYKSNKEKVELFDENGKKIKQKKTPREKYESAVNGIIRGLYITTGLITISLGQLLLISKVDVNE